MRGSKDLLGRVEGIWNRALRGLCLHRRVVVVGVRMVEDLVVDVDSGVQDP